MSERPESLHSCWQVPTQRTIAPKGKGRALLEQGAGTAAAKPDYVRR